MRRSILILATLAMLCPTASAQPVPSREPSSTHVFPAGGRRGTVVPVRIGGECLPPGARLAIRGAGVSAPMVLGAKLDPNDEPSPRRVPREVPICYPKEWESQIEISQDAPLGPRMWRLSCARGGTETRPFIVGDLPEHIETESNSLPQRAERITLPVTVNGRTSGENDIDYFVFSAEQGQVIVCDMVAGRIGSPLDPVLEIQDSVGHRMAVEEIRVGTDPVLAFRAPSSGDYRLQISNVSFLGGPNYVYRLTLSTDPYVAFAFPAGGQSGETKEIQLFALNGAGTPRVLTETVTFDSPADQLHWVNGRIPIVNPVPLAVGDLPEQVEQEPNDSAASAMHVATPVTVNGRFLSAGDEDWFSFVASKGQAYSITTRSSPGGSATLPRVALTDATGAVLAQASSTDSPVRECHIDWIAPADGLFLIRLRDVQQGVRGGLDFIYRLSIGPAVPGYALALKADSLNVQQGAAIELEVTAQRTGGFTGPIELAIERLPELVDGQTAQIPAGQSSGKLTLRAANDARPHDTALRVIGRASVGDRKLERIALAPHAGRDREGTSVGPAALDYVYLTVQHKPVFRLYCNEAYQYAHRGTVYPYLMQVERLDGFDGEIVVQLGDRQNRDLDGVEFFEVVVPPGATDVKLPIYLPESMHINVLSHSQVYAQAYAIFQDRWGEKQSVLVVSEKRCMVRTLPTVAKLRAVDKEIVARPGSTVRCTLELDRTSNFPGACELELVTPSPESGFEAEPVRIQPGQSRVQVAVQVHPHVVAQPDLELAFRATGKLPPDATLVSEVKVPVRFE